MPDNRSFALNRFYHTRRRLRDDAALDQAYVKVMTTYLSLGYGSRLTEEKIKSLPVGRTWFLPHHPVLKHGKWRVVFDAAATYNNVSLNSLLLKGPIDQIGSLLGVLIRFRQHRIALSADIVKMFHQVRVTDADRSFFCFWWCLPDSNEPRSMHRMNVQIFGSICSPSICSHILRLTAQSGGKEANIVYHQVVDH